MYAQFASNVLSGARSARMPFLSSSTLRTSSQYSSSSTLSAHDHRFVGVVPESSCGCTAGSPSTRHRRASVRARRRAGSGVRVRRRPVEAAEIAGHMVVETDDLEPLREQAIAEMRSKKTGAASHEYSFACHRGPTTSLSNITHLQPLPPLTTLTQCKATALRVNDHPTWTLSSRASHPGQH